MILRIEPDETRPVFLYINLFLLSMGGRFNEAFKPEGLWVPVGITVVTTAQVEMTQAVETFEQRLASYL
jgi:hypothetical protein